MIRANLGVRFDTDGPNGSQLALLWSDLETLFREHARLLAPLDIRTLPSDRIDERRLKKIQRRLLDECEVKRAAILTAMAGLGAELAS